MELWGPYISRVSYNLSYPFFKGHIYQGVIINTSIDFPIGSDGPPWRGAIPTDDNTPSTPSGKVTRAIAEGDTIGREVEDNAKAPRFPFGKT